jgi:hypothetical protein
MMRAHAHASICTCARVHARAPFLELHNHDDVHAHNHVQKKPVYDRDDEQLIDVTRTIDHLQI